MSQSNQYTETQKFPVSAEEKAPSCCSATKQKTCCEPSEKSTCCAPEKTSKGGCGCQ